MEQGVFAHSTVMPEGQDVEHGTTDNAALDAAATRLLTAPSPTLSVAAAIKGHRAAREALNAACPATDTLAIKQAGGDTSDEAMAPALAIWEAADQAEHDALDRLLAVRPTDPAELAQVMRYLAGSHVLDDIYHGREGLQNLTEMAETIAASRSAAGPSTEIVALASGLCEAFFALSLAHADLSAGRISDEQWLPFHEAVAGLADKLSRVPAASVHDMALKSLALAVDGAWEIGLNDDPAKDYMDKRIGRQFTDLIESGRFRSSFPAIAASKHSGPSEPPSLHANSSLAEACEWAIKHVEWMNETCRVEEWGDERLDKEMDRYGDVWQRATREPARTIPNLVAKAKMFGLDWLEHNPEREKEHDQLDKMLLSLLRDVAELERARPPLVDRLLDAWGEWAKTSSASGDDETGPAWERNAKIRDALIDEADALPATRENALAKAVASAWISYVSLWEKGRGRGDYMTDGRLVLDIYDAVSGATLPALTPSPPPPTAVPHHGIVVADQTMDSLRSIFDVAGAVGDICRAFASQPRCKGSGGAGALVEWISEETLRLMDACQHEANRRQVTCGLDRETRLSMLARSVIDNGDNDQTLSFARDVTAMVEARS